MATNKTPVKPTGDPTVDLSFRVVPTEVKVGLCVSKVSHSLAVEHCWDQENPESGDPWG